MSNGRNQIIEQLESRQFLSAEPGRPDGPPVVATGSADPETDDAQRYGHVMDYAASKARAAADPPPRSTPAQDGFSLHAALLDMAAAFEQSNGRPGPALGGQRLPWPGGPRGYSNSPDLDD